MPLGTSFIGGAGTTPGVFWGSVHAPWGVLRGGAGMCWGSLHISRGDRDWGSLLGLLEGVAGMHPGSSGNQDATMHSWFSSAMASGLQVACFRQTCKLLFIIFTMLFCTFVHSSSASVEFFTQTLCDLMYNYNSCTKHEKHFTNTHLCFVTGLHTLSDDHVLSLFVFKVKLSPKSKQSFICDWIWVKPSSKSINTTKDALLRFTVFAFSGTLILNRSARGIDMMASKSLFLEH